MTNKIDDGGPAYPVIATRTQIYISDGMTLRDWFAGQAINGMLSHSTRYRPYQKDRGLYWHDAIAYEAYELADAMIAARKEKL